MRFSLSYLQPKRDFIHEAISNMHWRGDEGPVWVESRDRRPCPSAAVAEADRLQVIKLLYRHAEHRPREAELIRRIKHCTPTASCGSGACPACKRAAQRFVVKQGNRFFRAQSRELVCISAIPLEGFNEGRLPPDPFQVLGDRVIKVLAAAGVPWAFVGFDLSLNECPGTTTQYRPHAWIIAEKEAMKLAANLLRGAFPRDWTTTPRPIVVKRFDGGLPGIAYAFKREFYRRQTVPAEVAKDGSLTRRNTRERPLRALQKVEVMLAMDALGFGGRVLLHGLEFRRFERGWRMAMVGDNPS